MVLVVVVAMVVVVVVAMVVVVVDSRPRADGVVLRPGEQYTLDRLRSVDVDMVG